MSYSLFQCIDDIFSELGIAKYGVARAEKVDAEHIAAYKSWISAGSHASMSYMERYEEVRDDPRLLLDDAKSVISCAIPYPSPCSNDTSNSPISSYALGSDYHEVAREKLQRAALRLTELMGGTTRVCIDTAPIFERYWAQKCGLGFIGRNHHLIIPELGSCFFLGEIITTLELEPNKPLNEQCLMCGKCLKACPTGALQTDGSFDARKCLSYLTIEHRGEFEPGTDLHGHLYGCDVCAAVCPHNQAATQCNIDPLLQPRNEVKALTVEKAASLTQTEFSKIFSHSAVKRTKLAGLQRNALTILNAKDNPDTQNR